jgi:hypothetical protein
LLNEALQIAEIEGETERKTERIDREGRQKGETERGGRQKI